MAHMHMYAPTHQRHTSDLLRRIQSLVDVNVKCWISNIPDPNPKTYILNPLTS